MPTRCGRERIRVFPLDNGPHSVGEGGEATRGRRASRLGAIARDPVAVLAAAVLVILVFALTAGGPLAQRVLGHGPNDLFPYAVDPNTQRPVGPWTRVSTEPSANFDEFGIMQPPAADAPTTVLVLGADGSLGRDEFLRLLVGGRSTLAIAVLGTLLALALGALLGAAAAYLGGLVDAAVERLSELVMAFPILLLLLVLSSSGLPRRLDSITFGGALAQGSLTVVAVIGCFTWFYPARIVRAQVLMLRRSEFVEAATMIGAGRWRVLRSHLLPQLVSTLVALGLVAVATNMMLEVGVTFFGVGVKAPSVSWGTMLAETWSGALTSGTIQATKTVWLTLIPSVAIFLTVLSLNIVGDALRERSAR